MRDVAIVGVGMTHFGKFLDRSLKSLSAEEYERDKRLLIESTIAALEKYLPDVRRKLDHVEAATPRTFHRYTRHVTGATFGTKFEGLKVSMDLPKQLAGLFHAGSVGIIMSGWLGAINYGVIVANEIDNALHGNSPAASSNSSPSSTSQTEGVFT